MFLCWTKSNQRHGSQASGSRGPWRYAISLISVVFSDLAASHADAEFMQGSPHIADRRAGISSLQLAAGTSRHALLVHTDMRLVQPVLLIGYTV